VIVRFVDIGGIVDHHYLHFCWEWRQLPGADPGFQVRGGALKINCAERREARKCLGYFVWKITILRQKIILFPILGGAHPPLDPPLVTSLKQRAFIYIYIAYGNLSRVVVPCYNVNVRPRNDNSSRSCTHGWSRVCSFKFMWLICKYSVSEWLIGV
jgi:hypothetical protein